MFAAHLLGSLAIAFCSGLPGESWPQFRGPGSDGQVGPLTIPTNWDEETNVAWKLPLPGSGWSQPVVAQDRVFVTCAVSDEPYMPKKMAEGSADPRSIFGDTKPPETVFQWVVLAVDLESGQVIWQKTASQEKSGIPTHPSNTFATETPATDGARVYAYFGSIGKVFAYDLEGQLKWEADVGVYPMTSGLGTGSSPIVYDGKVFIQSYNEENSFVVALDAESGQEAWRATRENGTSWSTPYLWKTKDRVELVACGKSRVFSYDPKDGSVNWEMGGIVGGFAATPVGNAEVLYLGNNGPLSPAPLLALKAGGSGDITPPKKEKTNEWVLWHRLRFGPGLCSPVLIEPYLYTATDTFINCYDTSTGERVYRERLPNARNVVASPWVAGDLIFFLDEEGKTFVVKQGPAFEIVSVNPLKDTFWASSAIANETLLLRGVENLYAVRASEK